MCGRFVSTGTTNQLAAAFDATPDATSTSRRASFNVAPTSTVAAVRISREGRVLSGAHWGFMAPWIRTRRQRPQPVNARDDKLASPMYRAAFTSWRVVVPADGFYEWRTAPDATKTAIYIHHADTQRLSLAAIASWWTDPTSHDADPWLTVAIVTTDAGEQMRDLHHRQPVMLTEDETERWLESNSDHLFQMTAPRDVIPLAHRQVSTDVNNPRNDHPGLVHPAG